MEKPVNPFETVATTVPDRNVFDLSYENRLTAGFGELIPCYLQEVLPGDTINLNQEIFCRFQPMLAPIMQRIDAYVHYFFVPNRLAYKDWSKFIVGGPDGTDTEHFIAPYTTMLELLKANGTAPIKGVQPVTYGPNYHIPVNGLCDYLGIPTTEVHGQVYQSGPYIGQLMEYPNTGYLNLDPSNPYIDMSMLKKEYVNIIPFRDYQLIYDEYYRDENLIPSQIYDDVLGTGVITNEGGLVPMSELAELIKMRWRAFKKDYFTSALPWQQKGPAVTLPLAGTAPINATSYINWNNVDPNNLPGFVNLTFNPTTASGSQINVNLAEAGTNTLVSGEGFVTTTGTVNLGSVNSTTLNDFRVAVKTQEWLEKNARGGSRYIETLLCHFGVMTPDARLQRPEYITGCKVPVMISDIEQNSASFQYQLTSEKPKDGPKAGETVTTTYGTTPLGYLAGKAIVSDESNANFSYYSYEHGYIMGILSIMPKTSYSQGLPRHFSRLDKFDYYWPSFAHLGEQGVKNKELYYNWFGQGVYTGPDSNDAPTFSQPVKNDDEFGYQSRYCEYKVRQDEIHGDFKSTLDYWHMSRFFALPPELNQEFIEARSEVTSDPTARTLILDYGDFNRCFAVGDEWQNQILVDIYFDVKALRPIPRYSIPSF